MSVQRKKIFLVVCFAFFIGISACSFDKPDPMVDDGYLNGAGEAKIYYQVMGSGKDTLVIVHGGPGAGMNSVMPDFKPLAEKYVLIFYDQRGGGKSELPADTSKLKPNYFVEDLEAVRTYFGLEKMNLVTHSFGSVLVAEYAKKYPDHLRRLVFHGATGPNLMQEIQIRRKKAEIAPSSPDSFLSNKASGLLRKLLNGSASDPVGACREYYEINRKLAIARGEKVTWQGTTCDAPSEAVAYYYQYTAQLAPRYFAPWDFTKGLEGVKVPLLVVWGKEDSLMIPAQQAWADAVSNGELLLVPKAGKAAISENPEFVLPKVENYFKE